MEELKIQAADRNNNLINDNLENQKFFIAIYFPVFAWLMGLALVLLVNYFPPKNNNTNNSLDDIAYGLLIGGGIGTGLANKKDK